MIKITHRFIVIVSIFVVLMEVINYIYEFNLFLIVPKLILYLCLIVALRSFAFNMLSLFGITAALIRGLAMGSLADVLQELSFLIKILLFLMSISYITGPKIYFSKNQSNWVLGYILLNIVLTWLGLGNANYGRLENGIPFGSKGIYASGNEFGIVFFAVSIMALTSFYSSLYRKFVIFGMGFMIGTKVAIAASIITFYSVVVYQIKRLNFLSLLLIFAAVSPAAFALSDFVIERYSYELSVSSSFLSFMLSGRDAYITSSLSAFINKPFVTILFGVGFECIDSFQCGGVHFVENDFFDLIFIYGVLMGPVIFIIFFVLCYGAKVRHPDLYFPLLLLGCVAAVAGHVFYNSIFPALLICCTSRSLKTTLNERN